MLAEAITDLVQLFARLPGIGERTAMRLAFHVLDQDAHYAETLGQVLSGLHSRIQRCVVCQNYSSGTTCDICQDARRDHTLLCVVGRIQDLVAIERASNFRGRYHVLHKLLAPLDGIGPDDLPLEALCQRMTETGVTEVIIATPLSVEGEATALYLAESLKPLNVKVSRIASGIPHGGDLEFADQITLGRAFEGRRTL